MNLGIILTPGDSLEKQSKTGQDDRFIKYYLNKYSKYFSKVFVFSYGDNKYRKKLPVNVILLKNKFRIPYIFYQFFIPLLYYQEIESCAVLRVMQATGGIPAIISKLIFNKKYVVTYGYDYSLFAKIEKKGFTSLLFKLLVKSVLAYADKIIVTSMDSFQMLKKKIGRNIYYIPNGVDVVTFKYKYSLSLDKHAKHKKINILSIGRLVPQKNYQLLIEAVALSNFKNIIEVLIIGNGPQETKLKGLAKKKEVKLKIIASIKHTSLPFYYNKAEIFCLPSLVEGQSKVLLEALSCGLPVFASKTPANMEIIRDGFNGVLFNLNPGDLSEKIDSFIQGKINKQKLISNARKFILKNHNLKKLVAEEIKILKKN